MSEFGKSYAETSERKAKKGRNVTIRNFWQRHAQKQSGEVFNTDKTGISTSAISKSGAERATNLGKTIVAGKDGAKGYKRTSARTEETFDAEMIGYAEANPGTPIREKVRVREQLIAPGNAEFIKLYDELWSQNKKTLLAERGLELKDFGALSPDEQEQITEMAEEPVIQDWIDNPKSELAKAFPPREAAANFAILFNRRHERMAEKLNSGSEIDLFHNTHKTTTEAFLASGVLVRKSDGKKITKIAELGGSLKILDNWESIVKTDEEGKGITTILIRGEKFDIDQEALINLINEGIQRIKEQPNIEK